MTRLIVTCEQKARAWDLLHPEKGAQDPSVRFVLRCIYTFDAPDQATLNEMKQRNPDLLAKTLALFV